MWGVPCDTHLGVRTTLADNPADIEVKTLRRPKSFEKTVERFSNLGLVTPGRPVPSWESACRKTKKRAKDHVLANRLAEIGAYVRDLGIEDETLAAAIDYARWSAAAEYRLLAAAGIHVNDIAWDDLQPFLGRGRMPVLETVKLSDLLSYTRQDLELVAWAQGQGEAYGSDKYVLMTSILRQIYQRVHLGHAISHEERSIAKDLLKSQGAD